MRQPGLLTSLLGDMSIMLERRSKQLRETSLLTKARLTQDEMCCRAEAGHGGWGFIIVLQETTHTPG